MKYACDHGGRALSIQQEFVQKVSSSSALATISIPGWRRKIPQTEIVHVVVYELIHGSVIPKIDRLHCKQARNCVPNRRLRAYF